MASMWYYIHEGRQYGPVSGAEIKKLAAGGQLLPTDLVWKDGMPEWVPASRIKGLFTPLVANNPSPSQPSDPIESPSVSPGKVPQLLSRENPTSSLPPKPPLEHVLSIITDKIPDTHRHLLLPGEIAYHFEWIDNQGGCGTTKSSEKYILITDQRVLYETTVQEGEGRNLRYVRTSGSIPLSKISFVGTHSSKVGCNQSLQNNQGCFPRQMHLLKVSSGGNVIFFPFFSEQKVKRVQRVIEELISLK